MFDAATYYWVPYYDSTNPDPDINFVPVPGGQTQETCETAKYQQYISGQFVTPDSSIGMNKVWVAPTDQFSFVMEEWEIYSFEGNPITGLRLGEYVDVDVPADTGVNNFGVVVEAEDYLYVTGQESDGDLCTPSDGRFYVTGLMGYYTSTEKTANGSVNHTGLAGVYVTIDEDLMPINGEFDIDSVWEYLNRGEFVANNAIWTDQRTLLSFGSFDIAANDTLVIWVMHGSLINSTDTDVADMVTTAKTWYLANRDETGTCGCCGEFTGGRPGNTDCDILGKMNLADITKLIDRVYISKALLCCEENGNVDGDLQGKLNLADITKLIDVVYISKPPPNPCL